MSVAFTSRTAWKCHPARIYIPNITEAVLDTCCKRFFAYSVHYMVISCYWLMQYTNVDTDIDLYALDLLLHLVTNDAR